MVVSAIPSEMQIRSCVWYRRMLAYNMQSEIAVLVIGDEILKAQVEECNFFYIARCLLSRGYGVGEVRIVGDEVDTIAQAIRELCAQYQYVITSGGIGPTHDDVSMEGIAQGFDVQLQKHGQFREYFTRIHPEPLPRSVEKMTMLPEGSEIFGTQDGQWPLIRKENCIILPGLPELLKKKMVRLLEWLPAREPLRQAVLFLQTDEHFIAEELSQLQQHHPLLAFGSYPVTEEEDYNVRISISGTDTSQLKTSFEKARQIFAPFLVRVQAPSRI